MITVGYLVIMLLTVLVRFESFLKLELNALGDFLAGAFAPLALLWLVIGYFQQGDELRQNSRALLLQAEELRQAANHAGGLLDVARREHELAMEKLKVEAREREAEAERQAKARELHRKNNLQPRLLFDLAFIGKDDQVRVKLTNRGHSCTNFSLEAPENPVLQLLNPVEVRNLEAYASLFFDLEVFEILGTTPVIARWTDSDGDSHESAFIASVADNQLNIDN